MIEKIVREFLSEKMQLPTVLEEPEKQDRSEKYLLVEKLSDSEENHIYTARIAVQSYAPSLEAAAELNEQVRSTMKQLTLLSEVAAVYLVSDYNFTDTATHRYRYQAVFSVSYY